MLTTVLEVVSVALVSLLLFAVWSEPAAAALLPWAALSGLLAWNRGGWGRP